MTMADHYTTAQLGEAHLQAQSSFFARLPTEIRLEIYEHLSTAPQHVEKAWDKSNRRAHLTRRLQKHESDSTSRPFWSSQHKTWLIPSSSSAPGLSLLLTCRRAYLEASTLIQPRNLVFTDLDALSAYLSWPSLTRVRHRAREIECSWHAEGSGVPDGAIPAWKAERWGACCDALATLPRIRRIRACIFSFTAQEKMVDRLRELESGRRVRVDVQVVGESAEYRFMTGRNLAQYFLFT